LFEIKDCMPIWMTTIIDVTGEQHEEQKKN